MRLTLRTLLAYMDDILDPADHEDLGKKIEASDFATELIHRSRDTVRRLRLGAPAIAAGEAGDDVLDSVSVADANVVAEYLDNTLSPEDVAEFERVCLEPGSEADMHLAEVASSHHVLTMVLGEPAEVDVDVRRRMYELPAKLAKGEKLRIEPAHADHQLTSEPATSVAKLTPRSAEPHAAEVPDYLRAAADHSRRNRRWATVAAMLVVGGFVGWLANGLFEKSEPPAEIALIDPDLLSGELVIEQDIAQPVVGADDTDAVEESSSTESLPMELDSPREPETQQDEIVALPSPPDRVEPQAEVVEPQTEVPEMEPAEDASPASIAGSTVPSIGPDEVTTIPPIGLPSPPAAASEADAPTSPAIASPAIVAETMPDLIVDEQPEPQPTGPVRLGNYQGNNDVLLRHDRQSDKWVRLPPRSAISSGDTLLTLPKFRTHVVLANVNAYLSDGTRLEMPAANSAESSAAADVAINIVYGRVLLNAGIEGARVALQIGNEVRSVQLGSSASLAIEVRRIVVPGTDYLEQHAPIEAIWHLTSGNVQWPSASGDLQTDDLQTGHLQTLEAPATWTTVDGVDTPVEAIDQLPSWIDREAITDMQRRARANIAEQLVAGEAVGLRLLELTDEKGLGRQREVRTLAAESGIHVGQFEPFVKAINDSRQSRAWNEHIRSLQQALALSPDVAARVRDAFVAQRGAAAADDLMEMLGGYSAEAVGATPEAAKQGDLPILIGWLEHDSLDYRVLAIHNLNEIKGVTGRLNLDGFLPAGTSQRRKIAVAKIWDRLESGDLLSAP